MSRRVIRCGDRWQSKCKKVGRTGANPTLFVWDMIGDSVELRSYEVEKGPEPLVHQVNKFDLFSDWSLVKPNEAGRILAVVA